MSYLPTNSLMFAEGQQRAMTTISETDQGLVSFHQSVMSAFSDTQTDDSNCFMAEQTLSTSIVEAQQAEQQVPTVTPIQEVNEQNMSTFQQQHDSNMQIFSNQPVVTQTQAQVQVKCYQIV